MSITGNPDGPPRKAGSALADGISGAFAASAILAALFEARESGQGQFVDVAMAHCLVSLVLDEPLDCYPALGLPPQQGNRIMRFSPFDTFATVDGDVTIGVATSTEWRALLAAIGRLDLEADPRFMNIGWRLANNDVVNEVVQQWSATRTMAEVLETMRCYDVPASPIRGIADLMEWRHLRERGMIEPVPHPTVTPAVPAMAAGMPVKFGRTPGGYHNPAPTLGQHNEEVFGGRLGLGPEERERLATGKVI